MRKILLLIAIATLIAACRKHEAPRTATTATTATTPSDRSAPAPLTPSTATETKVGEAMPAYKAELLDGKPFDIAAERGNVVFLNLWATWCGPCRFEIPELQKLHNQYASQGLRVVGVSLDESGKDAVQQFVTEHSMTYPIALDPDGKLANVFQTTVIPTSALIDRNGAITVDDELKQALDKALAQKPARPAA